MLKTSVIKSIGVYIPETKESNFDLLNRFDITEEFITRKIGVHSRAIKNKTDNTSDLCVKAFYNLKSKTDIDIEKINLVCVVTQNPDQKIPHTAAIVHQKLGLTKNCMTFDISQGCAGFPHGISIVSSLMSNLSIQDALLFTCDPYSKIINQNDKNTALLFGDAATVTFISNNREQSGYCLQGTTFGTVPGSNSCLTCEDKLQMNGRDVVSNALREVPENINSLLRSSGLKISDIDLFVLHQASRVMVESLRDLLILDEETAPYEIMNLGNTISSSIPIVLSKHVDQLTKDNILISGFGVGFSYASSLLKLIK